MSCINKWNFCLCRIPTVGSEFYPEDVLPLRCLIGDLCTLRLLNCQVCFSRDFGTGETKIIRDRVATQFLLVHLRQDYLTPTKKRSVSCQKSQKTEVIYSKIIARSSNRWFPKKEPGVFPKKEKVFFFRLWVKQMELS